MKILKKNGLGEGVLGPRIKIFDILVDISDIGKT